MECGSPRVSKGGRFNMDTLDDHGFDIYEENRFPIAYLLTFRTYGSWLHGDPRMSVNRNGNTRYGSPKRDLNVPLLEKMNESRRDDGVTFGSAERLLVEKAIVEVCEHRTYFLSAINVRTNHVHAVVSIAIKPERIVNDFKAYSTRALRANWLFNSSEKVWSRGASTRYLWKPRHVEAAVDYVKYCQEDIPFEFKEAGSCG